MKRCLRRSGNLKRIYLDKRLPLGLPCAFTKCNELVLATVPAHKDKAHPMNYTEPARLLQSGAQPRKTRTQIAQDTQQHLQNSRKYKGVLSTETQPQKRRLQNRARGVTVFNSVTVSTSVAKDPHNFRESELRVTDIVYPEVQKLLF